MRHWRQIVELMCASGTAMLLAQPLAAVAQTTDFQIVWINVGEVASAAEGQPARAGRQLFMAPDLVEFSLKKITVARVEVAPTVVAVKIGEEFCLTSLSVVTNADDRKEVDNAPLAVSVRQDQRERLSLRRAKNDICFSPTTVGEYPVRFNSLLPARDGSTRGAQIFLRVQADDVDADRVDADRLASPGRAAPISTTRFAPVDTADDRVSSPLLR